MSFFFYKLTEGQHFKTLIKVNGHIKNKTNKQTKSTKERHENLLKKTKLNKKYTSWPGVRKQITFSA